MSAGLKTKGCIPSSIGSADVIIINACTLTDGAERDIKRFVSRSRTSNGNARIILTGCHAQVYPHKTFGADLILGQDEKFTIYDFLERKGCFVEAKTPSLLEKTVIEGLQDGRTRFFLKIQDGCDRFCTYCIVPYARGAPRSRPAGDIIDALKTLKDRGVKEVVLTGIEVSSYRDPTTGMDLKALLGTLETLDTPTRIRLSSIDPLYLDDEFLRVFTRSVKIAKSLHISVQSGSDPILERMGRKYTKEYVAERIARIKEWGDHVGIGLDVIAGFPTEDDRLFAETLRFIENLDIYYLHVFPYSVRPGTRAALMKDDVPERTKRERVRSLRRLDTLRRTAFYERHRGKEAWIVPEGKLYRGLYMRGYSDNYIPVYVPYKKSFENSFVKVTMTVLKDGFVMGETDSSKFAVGGQES
jgi:threonylcarbamoyladenosine tRNA methylthiotransferase MtaB